MEQKSHLMSTQNRASRSSLWNQTVGIKVWVRATEYHPTSKLQAEDALFHSPAELSETHLSSQIEAD
jgi:hypothetical protein